MNDGWYRDYDIETLTFEFQDLDFRKQFKNNRIKQKYYTRIPVRYVQDNILLINLRFGVMKYNQQQTAKIQNDIIQLILTIINLQVFYIDYYKKGFTKRFCQLRALASLIRIFKLFYNMKEIFNINEDYKQKINSSIFKVKGLKDNKFMKQRIVNKLKNIQHIVKFQKNIFQINTFIKLYFQDLISNNNLKRHHQMQFIKKNIINYLLVTNDLKIQYVTQKINNNDKIFLNLFQQKQIKSFIEIDNINGKTIPYQKSNQSVYLKLKKQVKSYYQNSQFIAPIKKKKDVFRKTDIIQNYKSQTLNQEPKNQKFEVIPLQSLKEKQINLKLYLTNLYQDHQQWNSLEFYQFNKGSISKKQINNLLNQQEKQKQKLDLKYSQNMLNAIINLKPEDNLIKLSDIYDNFQTIISQSNKQGGSIVQKNITLQQPFQNNVDNKIDIKNFSIDIPDLFIQREQYIPNQYLYKQQPIYQYSVLQLIHEMAEIEIINQTCYSYKFDKKLITSNWGCISHMFKNSLVVKKISKIIGNKTI